MPLTKIIHTTPADSAVAGAIKLDAAFNQIDANTTGVATATSNAATAQSTANTALSTANTANTTANTANTTANSASSAVAAATTAANAATAATVALQPIPINLSLASLRTGYTGSAVTGAPTVTTIDCGICQYSQQYQNWYPMHPFVVTQAAIPFIIPPSGYVDANGILILGQAPASSATATFSTTALGTGVTCTFSAATLLGTSSDNGRILTIKDTVYKYFTITAFSSTTVCTGTLSGASALSTVGAWANNVIWLSATSTGTTGYATPMPRVISDSYVYFSSGNLYTGNMPGLYYATWQSSTVATVKNNIYMGLQPAIPASPLAISSAAMGTYTQLTTGTNAISMQYAAIPGNVLNQNGMIEARYVLQTPNNANTKQINFIFGGTNFAGDTLSTTGVNFREYWRMIQNAGSNLKQTIFSSSTGGSPGTGSAIGNQSINTTIGQNVQLQCYMATVDTDYMIVESLSVTVTPSAVVDAQITPSVFIPSASIIPPGAAALGISTNTWLAFPQFSDVSYTDTDTSHKLYAGQYYNTHPPYLSTDGYLQDTTINGTHFLQINQKGNNFNAGVATQNQNSVAGTLPWAASSNGFYFEIASLLLTPNGFNTDNFPGIFINPTEHNAANGPAYPYVEFDISEGWVFALNSNNPYFGDCNSIVDWPSGSGGASTTINNSNAANAGPNINRNQINIHGFGLDPVGQTVSWWLNGNLQQTKSIATQVAAGRVLGRHYYLIFGASSRTGGTNAAHAYSHLIQYIALWGG